MRKCSLDYICIKPKLIHSSASDRSHPWATNFPPYQTRFKAAFAVWLFLGLRGSFRLGKTYWRLPLIGRMISSSSKACSDKGTTWSRFVFISSAGIHHCLFYISISIHAVADASAGRISVSSCHSSRQRVGIDKFLIEMVRISLGSSSGRIVGMCCLIGRSKALPIPEAVLASINPTLTA